MTTKQTDPARWVGTAPTESIRSFAARSLRPLSPDEARAQGRAQLVALARRHLADVEVKRRAWQQAVAQYGAHSTAARAAFSAYHAADSDPRGADYVRSARAWGLIE